MGLPSKKRTKTSALERAAHFALKISHRVKCTKCGGTRLPHVACPTCGAYKDRKVS